MAARLNGAPPMNKPKMTKVQEAARLLLEHVSLYAMSERLGGDAADAFISELALIADGKVRFGALVANH